MQAHATHETLDDRVGREGGVVLEVATTSIVTRKRYGQRDKRSMIVFMIISSNTTQH